MAFGTDTSFKRYQYFCIAKGHYTESAPFIEVHATNTSTRNPATTQSTYIRTHKWIHTNVLIFTNAQQTEKELVQTRKYFQWVCMFSVPISVCVNISCRRQLLLGISFWTSSIHSNSCLVVLYRDVYIFIHQFNISHVVALESVLPVQK